MKKRLAVALMAAVLALAGSVARAGVASATPITTLYVNATTGNPTFDCLSETVGGDNAGPCQSISQALGLIDSSDAYDDVGTIDVAAGTYTEANPLDISVGNPGLDPGGLTIEGVGGTVTVRPQTADESLFAVSGGSSDSGNTVTLEDLTLTGSTAATPADGPDEGGGVDNSAQDKGAAGLVLDDDQVSDFGVTGNGGGVYNSGDILIEGTTVSDNVSESDGGGLFNAGMMTLEADVDSTGSTVSGNKTASGSGANGGGIASENVDDTSPVPSLTVASTNVSDNTADGGGGGIHVADSGLSLSSSTVEGNTASTGTGGGLWVGDDGDDANVNTQDMEYSVISGNTASLGDGGGIWVEDSGGISEPTIEGDVISGNTAPDGDGGGIWSSMENADATAALEEDTIGSDAASPALPASCPAGASTAADAPNSALEGGGVYNAGTVPDGSSLYVDGATIDGNCASSHGGGGLYTGLSMSPGVTVDQSTVADNESIGGNGGGILSDDGDYVTIDDSTVAGNEVVGADGGGIESSGESTLYLLFSTVIDNSAVSTANDPDATGGGIDDADTGAPSDQPALADRPLAVPSGDTLDNCTNAVGQDLGFNLEDDSDGQCGFSSGTDVTTSDPDLGPLTDHPGADGTDEPDSDIPYPPTAIPEPGSPAVTDTTCDTGELEELELGADELGYERSGEPCYIGAVQESDLAPVFVSGPHLMADEAHDLADAALEPDATDPLVTSGGALVADNYDVPHQAPAPPPSGSSTPTTTTPTVTTTTVGGTDRVATSVLVSQTEFPNGKAGAVVLARDDLFPDALAGVPFAVAKDAPLLLSDPTALSPETAAEIQRVLPAGGTVYLLGATDALSGAVESAVQALGYRTVRIGGLDRYATAIDIAEALGNPKTVFEADGTDFPDALSAGSAAVLDKGAILLTDGSSQDAETAAYLATLDPTTKYALGGPAAAADPSATAIVGADRYATAALVAAKFFPKATGLGVATGLDFPDALSGGALEASLGNPILLVSPSYTSASDLPGALASYLAGLQGTLKSITVFGSTDAVPTYVVQTLQAAVG